jgi:hypothetical protein
MSCNRVAFFIVISRLFRLSAYLKVTLEMDGIGTST